MSGDEIGNVLARVNAGLNTTSTVLLVLGYVLIRRKNVKAHRRAMIGAFLASVVFLIGYVTRYALTGSHRFPDLGWIRTTYLAILISHMILAIVALPLVLRTLFLGWKERYAEHRRWAKITYPIWLYVSFTGVVVYVMLYHVAPALAAP